ncbi:hypothetical protein C1701_18335 [Actinoalloteichus sp. AHMU CJ021]|uniref:XRE family transcriptional regulator n=1 Tax=Actinoalloteichus caeruleus DSM 43889 TaxID=1120930 RepID=A0ABT1JNP8_ACTCY|nr:hypothetical protein [Actinoalloteichus caeruleus]AUS79969.1 hypothetical protein C1701_18335 [Actinoalloteichus sp. AHMU CJ021]MCP2334152.1 hypothetical protein [Actinoalloteichus caeruleus DSM 43889]
MRPNRRVTGPPSSTSGPPRRDSLHRELQDALEHGPFSDALRLAIETSGLSLDRIQHRLAERGVRISLTTLSYWRHGRSRPERPESLRGVQILEEVLALPDSSLTALLGPRRPRGRWVSRTPRSLDMDQLFGDQETLRDLRASLGVPSPDQLIPLAVHDLLVVDARRDELAIRTRMVMQAAVDGVSSTFLVYRSDDPERTAAAISTRYCTLGEVHRDPASGFVMAELVLDRVLGTGEPTVFEYEMELPPSEPAGYHDRRFLFPTRQYVLQVQFAPTSLPTHCQRYYQASGDAPRQDVREVPLGASNAAAMIEVDLAAGIYGMNWGWS